MQIKVLIGYDGINSLVAKWLGLHKPRALRKRFTLSFPMEFSSLAQRICFTRTEWKTFLTINPEQKEIFEIRNKKKSPAKKITGFQFAPSSSSDVLLSCADSRIRIMQGSNVIQKFAGLRNIKSQIAASFTRNGKYVISASEDSQVYIWKRDEPRMRESGNPKPLPPLLMLTSSSCVKKFRLHAIPWPGSIKNIPPIVEVNKRHSKKPVPQGVSASGSPTREEVAKNSKKDLPPLPKKNTNSVESSSSPDEDPSQSRSLNKEKHQHKAPPFLFSKMSSSSTVRRVVCLICDVLLQQSDWSGLPKDLLELIFLRLRHAADLIRIRAVCRKWRSVANTLRHKPLCPLLLLNTDDPSDVYNLFDFSNNKIHRTRIYPTNQASCPKNLFNNGSFTNSCNGWLVRMECSVPSWPIHLINPFTRVEIQLPPTVTFEERVDSMTNRRFLRKAVLSSTPLDPKCVVAAIYCTYNTNNDEDAELKLALCSLRDTTWKKIKSDQAKDFFVDVIYFMDRFYALGRSNELFHCDINSNDEPKAVRISPPELLPEPESEPEPEREPEPEWSLEWSLVPERTLMPEMEWTGVGPRGRRSRSYLVDWCGDLLMVVRYSVFNKINITKTTKFKVFKFNFGMGRWEEVDSLGDGSIFISYSAMALLSIKEDIPQFESNSIYFTDDNDSKGWYYLRDAGKFCLSTKVRKPCRVIAGIWPPPMLWISPDLCTSVDSV